LARVVMPIVEGFFDSQGAAREFGCPLEAPISGDTWS